MVASVVSWLPFGKSVTWAVTLVGVFVIARAVTPNYDVPWVLGVADHCGGEPVAETQSVMYRAGTMVGKLNEQPPTVEAIYGATLATAEDAAKLWAKVEAGFKGIAEPAVEPEPLDDDTRTISDSGCVCPGTAVPVSGSGPALAASAALAAGWTGDDAVTAVAIAGAESGYDPHAANSTSTARGLWQTMMSLHEDKYDGTDWSDPTANARVAHEIWQDAGGWSPWTVYTSGAYRSHLAEAEAAVAAAQGDAMNAAYTSEPQAGLQPEAQRGYDFVRSEFGFTGTIHGHRVDPGSEHHVGLAIDVMVHDDKALGDRIAEYFAGPGRDAFGVNNVIWQQRITNAGRGWKWPGDMMEDRGDDTANHYDHVHIDFHAGGGTGATPAAAECDSGTLPISSGVDGGATILTANIPFWTPEGDYRARVRELLDERPDVLLGQEATDRNFRRYAQRGWGVVQFDGNGRAGEPIVYNANKFTLAASGVELGFDGHVYDRHLTWAALKGASGDLAVINLHMPTQAYDRPGRPYFAGMVTALEKLASKLEAAGYPVVVGADWNDDPANGLRGLGYRTNWQDGTPCDRTSIHGGRIDGFGYSDDLAVTDQGCLGKGPSDHYPVWATFAPAGDRL